MTAGFKPSTPVEFHWYSGEEGGLLGSQAVAKSYKSSGTTVKAFLQLDMSAYFKPGSKEVIALEAVSPPAVTAAVDDLMAKRRTTSTRGSRAS